MLTAKEEFMEAAIKAAIKVAKESQKHDNHAVGAVVIKNNKIIAQGEQIIKCLDMKV